LEIIGNIVFNTIELTTLYYIGSTKLDMWMTCLILSVTL